jgi:predicted Co/Zn/Cd cation transporter (cation efflux family)
MFDPATVIVLLLMALVFATLPVGQVWKTVASVLALVVGVLWLLAPLTIHVGT